MTALYIERYMNWGVTREELQSGKPVIGIALDGDGDPVRAELRWWASVLGEARDTVSAEVRARDFGCIGPVDGTAVGVASAALR